jgi:hypothetical protein
MRRYGWTLLLGLLLLASGTAWGYVLFDPPQRVGDPDQPYEYHLYLDLDEPTIDGDHEFDLVRNAFRNWQDQPENVDFLVVEGAPAAQCGVHMDGENTVSFQDCQNLCQPGVLAVTYRLRTNSADGFWTTGTDTLFVALLESDMVYCRNWNWDDPDQDWNPCPGGNHFDCEGVGTHEIGHMIGLDHTPVPQATMYFSIAPCDSTKRSLHWDDKRGARVMYRNRVKLEVADHDNFNGSLSVTNCANIAYTGAGNFPAGPGGWGNGFVWPAGGNNHIYESSMCLGVTNGPVADNFRTNENTPEDDDFIQLSPLQLMELPSGVQTGFGIWDDSKNDQPSYGVKVIFRSYSFPDPPDDDYVILCYWVVNESGSTINNLRVGIFTDFDLNGTYANNSVDYDADIGLGWVSDPSTPYEVGMTALNPEGVVTFRALAATGDTYSDANKTAWLQSGFQQTSLSNQDIAMLIATGTFDLAPGDTALAAFALLGGENHSDLRANALAAQTKFAQLNPEPGVASTGPVAGETRIQLGQNVPNPFAASTRLAFALRQEGRVRLVVTDAAGRLVRTLVSGTLPKGHHVFTWDGRDDAGRRVASGVYFYRLETPEATASRKMILLD